MKKLSFSVLVACFFLNTQGFSQTPKEQVLMTVGNDKVTVEDFLSVYKKNNSKESKVVDKKALEDYLNLYTIFRLKVKEARDLGLDTTTAFKDELSGYRRTLSQPYLADKNAIDSLVREAYERRKWDVRTSHILADIAAGRDTAEAFLRISIVKNFLKGKLNPADVKKYETLVWKNIKDQQYKGSSDTANAKNKISSIQEMLKLKNKDFAAVAKIVSEHASKDQGGDLGYTTGLSQFYPYEYESVAYKTNVGEWTGALRTSLGYHLVKVTEKLPHKEYHVAHLMLITKKDISKEDSVKIKYKIDSLSNVMKQSGNFEELTGKFSEHRETASKGGDLGWMTLGSNFPAEFKEGALKLKKDGDVSVPVKTRFGWHLIKLLGTRGLSSFDSVKTVLKGEVQNDSRSAVAKELFIKKLKAQYKFKETTPKNIADFYAVVDSSLLKNTWKADRAKALTKPMFTILDKTYTQQDFAKYIENNHGEGRGLSFPQMVDALYKPFVDGLLMKTKEDRLETEYPDFKSLMNEYRDGILLFNLTDQKVWSKAIKDTTGAMAYHEKNKNNYMWDERLNASIYTCKDQKTADKVRKMIQEKKTDKDIVTVLNKDTMIAVAIDGKTTFLKGDNVITDGSKWVAGLTPNVTERGKIVFANFRKVLPPTPKSFSEARGLITSDYQIWLEKQWIDSLKSKYPVSIDRKVFDTIQ